MRKFFLAFSLMGMIYAYAQHPNISEYNAYCIHAHNLSKVSDSTGSPSNAYNYAKNNAGLDFFGLTDHAEQISSSEWNTLKNAANNYNQDGAFTTFWGFEWSSLNDHLAVINSESYTNAISTLSFSALLNWVKAREFVAFINYTRRECDLRTDTYYILINNGVSIKSQPLIIHQ